MNWECLSLQDCYLALPHSHFETVYKEASFTNSWSIQTGHCILKGYKDSWKEKKLK